MTSRRDGAGAARQLRAHDRGRDEARGGDRAGGVPQGGQAALAGREADAWAATAMPASRTWRTKRVERQVGLEAGDRLELVDRPPVWASPRPLIVATRTPRAAASGAATIGVVSPTPPVECEVARRAEPAELEAVARGDQRAREGLDAGRREPAQARDHAPGRHQGVVGGAVEPGAHERLDARGVDGISPRRLRSITSTGARGAAMTARHSTPAARGAGRPARRAPAGTAGRVRAVLRLLTAAAVLAACALAAPARRRIRAAPRPSRPPPPATTAPVGPPGPRLAAPADVDLGPAGPRAVPGGRAARDALEADGAGDRQPGGKVVQSDHRRAPRRAGRAYVRVEARGQLGLPARSGRLQAADPGHRRARAGRLAGCRGAFQLQPHPAARPVRRLHGPPLAGLPPPGRHHVPGQLVAVVGPKGTVADRRHPPRRHDHEDRTARRVAEPGAWAVGPAGAARREGR